MNKLAASLFLSLIASTSCIAGPLSPIIAEGEMTATITGSATLAMSLTDLEATSSGKVTKEGTITITNTGDSPVYIALTSPGISDTGYFTWTDAKDGSKVWNSGTIIAASGVRWDQSSKSFQTEGTVSPGGKQTYNMISRNLSPVEAGTYKLKLTAHTVLL